MSCVASKSQQDPCFPSIIQENPLESRAGLFVGSQQEGSILKTRIGSLPEEEPNLEGVQLLNERLTS